MALPDAPPRASAAVARFMLGSLAAIAVVVVGGFFALRSVAIREAERDTRGRVELQGAVVESAGLSDGILRRDPAAIAKLDDVVAARLLSPSVVRVKLWSRDGRVLYSDEPAIIGRRFGLGAEERELFTEGGADAELSDLSLSQEGRVVWRGTVRARSGSFSLERRLRDLAGADRISARALGPRGVTCRATLAGD